MTDEANPSAPPGEAPRTAWDDRLPAGPAAPVAGPVDAVPLRLVAVGLLVAPGARGDVVGAVLGSGGTITLGGQVFSLAAVASAAAVLAAAGVVAELAVQAGDEVSAARWTRLRFVYVCSAVPGLAICLMLLVGWGGAPGMVLATVLLAVGSVTYLLLVWRAFRDARRPWALPGRGAAAPVTSAPITA